MRTSIQLAAFCLLAVMASQASASLLGLRVFQEGLYGFPNPTPNETRWIYRVYAEFTEPTDYLTAWGIGLSLGSGQIRNINSDGSPGTGFINIPDDNTGNLAPHNPLTARDWDTYMTMGVVYGSLGPLGVDGTNISPSTPTFITGGSTVWTGQIGRVSLDPPYTQGRADYWQFGNDTDTLVLLMQLVVNAGEHVDGSVGVIWRPQPSGAGVLQTDVNFSSVPEPTSVAMLLIVAVCVHRRPVRSSKLSYGSGQLGH